MRKKNIEISLSEYLKKEDRHKYEVINGLLLERQRKRNKAQQETYKYTSLAINAAQPYREAFSRLFPEEILLLNNNENNAIALVPDFTLVDLDSQSSEGIFTSTPKLIIEILTPENAQRTTLQKRKIYEQNRVPELWLIDPVHTLLQIFILNEEKQYQLLDFYSIDDKVSFTSLPSKKIPVRSLFENFRV